MVAFAAYAARMSCSAHNMVNLKIKDMEKTWRWFGKSDKITLAMLKQIGVEGILAAVDRELGISQE